MSKQRQKYLDKLSLKEREKLLPIIDQLFSGDFSQLDVKQLTGYRNIFRCRVGNIKIIFSQNPHGNINILKVGPRGDVYK